MSKFEHDIAGEVFQLRADLATVTAEREDLRAQLNDANCIEAQQIASLQTALATERRAHEETKAEWDKFRERVIQEAGTELEALVVTRATLESTQRELADMAQLRQKAESYGLKQDAALAAAEARVARVEALRDVHAKQTDNSVFSTALVEYINEALRG